MTSLFMIAAVLLGADAGQASSPIGLQQPTIAQQAEPVAVIFGQVPASQTATNTEKGLIRPVGYEPQPAAQTPILRLAETRGKAGFSLVQDASPSDSMARQHGGDSTPPPAPVLPSEVYPEGTASQALPEAYVADADYRCGDSCQASAHGCSACAPCTSCGCHGHHFGLWSHHGLPSVWHAPGNMLPHIPYTSYPKTYYYFRPYNMLHIPKQQEQAVAWAENPALPYSNKIFDKVYNELEPVLNAPSEEVEPGLIGP